MHSSIFYTLNMWSDISHTILLVWTGLFRPNYCVIPSKNEKKNRRYKYLVLGREGPYFVKEHSDSKSKYTKEDIIRILEFLVDNIHVVFAGKEFQQIIGIPIDTNCGLLIADLLLYSYVAEFIQSLLSAGRKRLASHFNFTYRYTDDVL